MSNIFGFQTDISDKIAVSVIRGEAVAPALTHWLYGKDVDDLTAEEKQTISSIIGLAGAAIGATTGNSADIVSGAQIGQNAVDNNYLSQYQQKQYGKELMQCKGDWCRIKVNGKWQIVNGAQQASLSAGIVSGIPMAIGESLEDLIHIATSPVETYNAIKSLINSGDVLGNVSAVLKQAYSQRIDNLIAQYEKAGASGSYKAGVEIGKLLTEIGTITAGGAGIGKGVAKVTDKVVGKLGKEAATGAKPIANKPDLGRKPNIGKGENLSILNPEGVRFSQNTVSYNKKDRITGTNYTYDDLVTSMKNNGWLGDPVDVIKMPDGKLTSMDNTRIAAAREAGVNIKAKIRDFNEPLTAEIKAARNWGQYHTWGEAIHGRINNQSGKFGTLNPNGSNEPPKIKGKK